ncbi:MAG: retropepsin-like aspartic protease [Candidatus Melainabacteria bacterium]|nr:retropepsin-like aspartic protease [Candidatus Melainabacteria bacterium]
MPLQRPLRKRLRAFSSQRSRGYGLSSSTLLCVGFILSLWAVAQVFQQWDLSSSQYSRAEWIQNFDVSKQNFSGIVSEWGQSQTLHALNGYAEHSSPLGDHLPEAPVPQSNGFWDSGVREPEESAPAMMAVVPLKPDKRALLLDAELNGVTNGTFIVDTGATYTSISTEMAESLGIDWRNQQTVTITTANGRIQVPKITLERIRIQGVEARDVEATVIDMREGSPFSGLLGLSFINQFQLTIDPRQGRLILKRLLDESSGSR